MYLINNTKSRQNQAHGQDKYEDTRSTKVVTNYSKGLSAGEGHVSEDGFRKTKFDSNKLFQNLFFFVLFLLVRYTLTHLVSLKLASLHSIPLLRNNYTPFELELIGSVSKFTSVSFKIKFLRSHF